MAGVLKGRDPGGTLRTPTTAKVRNPANSLTSLQFIRVRDPGGVLREVFTSGGGGGGGGDANPTSITPGSQAFSGKPTYRSTTATAMSSGAAPSSYLWGVADGPGVVVAGATTATATLQVRASAGETVDVTFSCDMVIGGTTFTAFCTVSYTNTLG